MSQIKYPKYESTTEPGLFFSVEPVAGPDGPVAYMVTQQMKGYPGTEACDDWFANLNDADAIAQQLAIGVPL
jgi:hypothetical protein